MSGDSGTKQGKRRPGRLWILCYHAICEGPPPLSDYCFLPAHRFAAQMRGLARSRFDVLALEAALAAQKAGGLERDTVAITFDDGYRNNITAAEPILARHGFPATLFVTTGLTDSDKLLWPNRILLALHNTSHRSIRWRGYDIPLTNASERCAANAALQVAVKALCPQAPGAAASEIEAALDCPLNPPAPPGSEFAMLAAAEISEAQARGVFRFGAHSVTHPILLALNDADLEAEIACSVRRVRDLTGGNCVGFSYPNGRRGDFDDRAVAILHEQGIDHAVTTFPQPNASETDAFRLGRLTVGASASWPKLRLKIWKNAMHSVLDHIGKRGRQNHPDTASRQS
jgi:peptidoglycan/xylan/chitin deacetylase (PgdA/CDA1 family)